MNTGSKITNLHQKAVDRYGLYPLLFFIIMFAGLGTFYVAGYLPARRCAVRYAFLQPYGHLYGLL